MTSTRPLRAVLGAAAAVLTLTLAACSDDEAGSATTESAANDTTASSDAETTVPATAETATSPTSSVDEGTAADGTTAGSTTAGSTSGEPADREAYVAAGVESFGAATGETAECVVNAVIDGVGFEMITATGLSPEEFWDGSGAPLADAGLTAESPEVVTVADGVAACDGLLEVFAQGATESVTDEQRSCLEDGGARELLGRSLSLSMIGADTAEVVTEGDALAAECGLN